MKPRSFLSAMLLCCGPFANAQTHDFGDLPDALYPTKLSQNGARHGVTQSLYIGNAAPDTEGDGQPTPTAQGDDLTSLDDEDGVVPSSLLITAGVPYNLRVKVTNTLVGNAWLHGFADWNQDGDFADPDETANVMVAGGSVGFTAVLPFNVPPSAVTTTPAALRLRLATASVLLPVGEAQDGEVEDDFIPVFPPGALRDFGDLPDAAAGTAPGVFFTGTPPDYRTLAADGGPSHGIRPGLNFANDTGSPDVAVDAETDGQPNGAVNGDDLNDDNDELGMTLGPLSAVFVADGPSSYFEMEQPVALAVTNVTGSPARVAAFLDENSDGDFADPGEQLPVVMVPGDGSVTSVPALFKFKVGGFAPAASVSGSLGVRIRITTDPSVGPAGPASDGEVMDTMISYQLGVPPNGYDPLDFGDLDATRYPVLRAANGARHVITQVLFLGNSAPDGEADGLSSIGADGDDLGGADDEDGFDPSSVVAVPGFPVGFPVKVTNATPDPATLFGFVDWNDDGDFGDAGESSAVGVPAGTFGSFAMLPWSVPAGASTAAPVAVRLRLSRDAGLGAAGRANDGEVEDFLIPVAPGVDFGDLPDPAYPTALASNGPHHAFSPGIYLGNLAPDLESDGAPSSSADGDDAAATDDEDGLDTSSIHAVPGFLFYMPVTATNLSPSLATLSGFIDWNADGDFADSGETSMKAVLPSTFGAIVKLAWTVPPGASTTSPVAVRLRLAKGGPLPPGGFAATGEVEDFFINVMAGGIDYGDLPDSAPGTAAGTFGTTTPPDYRTLLADGGPSHVMRPDLFFTNDSPEELAHLDPESDGQPGGTAEGDDLAGEDDEFGLLSAITRQTAIIDGVHSELEIELFTSLAVTNTTGTAAQVVGFIDVNSDGDFDDAGEQAPPVAVPGDGSVTVAEPTFIFRVGNLTSLPPAFTNAVRFRITTDTVIGPDGAASDGEVHDETLSYSISIDPIDPLSMDYGDHDATRYPVLWADDGARHVIKNGLFIGDTAPDGEVDGLSSVEAKGDDTDSGDDEDTPDLSGALAYRGATFDLPVKVTHAATTGPATLYGFADWNDDGDFADTGESASAVVPAASAGLTVPLSFAVPAAPASNGKVAVRLRLSTDAGLSSAGRANDGEVEDHFITVRGGWDFGDLPDSASGTAAGVVTDFTTISQGDYRTTLADNGPRHLMRPDLVLFNDANPTGVHVDGEADGLPSTDADGDDLDADDDEEVLYSAILRQVLTNPTATSADVAYDLYTSVTVKNETGVTAYLNGFLDANNDGDFSDPGETATVAVPSAAGFSTAGLTFSPSLQLTNHITSWTSRMPVRFRFSTTSGLGADGPAPDGEVEDYMVTATFSTGRWWPTVTDSLPPVGKDWRIDRGTPARLNVERILPPNFGFANGYQWHFGESTVFGNAPLLEPSFLQTLGNGTIPYSVSFQLYPGFIGSYVGWLDVRDLAGFRAFMTGHSLTGEIAAPDEDADGDGTSNFTEYAFGTDPAMPTLPPSLRPSIESDGGLFFTGSYLRLIGGTPAGAAYATPEVRYAPEASDDLTDWTKPVAGTSPPTGLPLPPAGYEWGAARIPAPVTGTSEGFLRLEVGSP